MVTSLVLIKYTMLVIHVYMLCYVYIGHIKRPWAAIDQSESIVKGHVTSLQNL